LCGARVGCLLSWNSEVITAAINFASTRVSACTIEQKAAAIMLDTIATDYLPNAIKTYQLRRNLLHKAITQIPGVSAQMPEGGFYIFAQLPVTNAQDFARFMLQDFQLNGKTLFISPATGFYIQNVDATTPFVRIAFVLDSLALEESSKILESALLEYKKIAPS
jgi:aspartate aminotransferase